MPAYCPGWGAGRRGFGGLLAVLGVGGRTVPIFSRVDRAGGGRVIAAELASPVVPQAARVRDDVVEVHRALRALLRRIRDERLTAVERRVLDGVIELTVTWCRLADQVTVAQVAETAGIARERTVREALARLAERGLIVWLPARGRPGRGGARSVAGLVPAAAEEIRRPASDGVPDSGAENRRAGAGVAPVSRRPGVENRRSGRPGGAEIRRLSRCGAPPPTGFGSSLREEPPPARTPAPAREKAPPAGGGGDLDGEEHRTAADDLLTAIAERLGIPAGALRLQRARVAEALTAGAWTPDGLRRHLLDDLPFPIRHPPALVGRRLEAGTLPDSPERCACRGCGRTIAARRQRRPVHADAPGVAARTPVDPDRLRARIAAVCAEDPANRALDELAARLGPDRYEAVVRRLSPFPGRPAGDPKVAAAVVPLLAARAEACGWDPDRVFAVVVEAGERVAPTGRSVAAEPGMGQARTRSAAGRSPRSPADRPQSNDRPAVDVEQRGFGWGA